MKKCKVQKLLASLMAASMVLGMAACGNDNSQPSGSSADASSAPPVRLPAALTMERKMVM